MYQINFTDIDVHTNDAGELETSTKENITRIRSNTANEKILLLQEAIEEFPSIEEHMIAMMEDTGNTLCAISITEVPLSWVDDHYERIPVNSRSATESQPNGKGKFPFYTLIGSDDSDGTASRYSDSLSVTYNNSPTAGESGDDFWRENGDSSYVRYALEDDPMGIRQCTSFILSTTPYAPRSTAYRQINSYYVHTWKQLSLGVSVSANSEKTVGLEITPSLTNKSWQVYNYVTFNF